MPAKDLGTKHLCFKCGTKFYDLKKSDPVCPKCGADQRQSPALKAPAAGEKRSRPPARPAPLPPPAPEPDADAELDEETEETDEDDDEDDDA